MIIFQPDFIISRAIKTSIMKKKKRNLKSYPYTVIYEPQKRAWQQLNVVKMKVGGCFKNDHEKVTCSDLIE